MDGPLRNLVALLRSALGPIFPISSRSEPATSFCVAHLPRTRLLLTPYSSDTLFFRFPPFPFFIRGISSDSLLYSQNAFILKARIPVRLPFRLNLAMFFFGPTLIAPDTSSHPLL